MDLVTHHSMTHSTIQKLISAVILAGIIAAFAGSSSPVGQTSADESYGALHDTGMSSTVNAVLHP